MDLLFIDVENIKEDSLLWNKYDNLLTETEKNKIYNLLKLNDRKISLASTILQKYVIANYFNKPLQSIIIKKYKYGKPYVENFEYSVSHDNNIVVILTSPSESVGIDIMCIDRVIDIKLFKSIFSIKEYKKIKNLKDFYIFWCLKESYVKAIGYGISFGLDRIEFNIDDYSNIKLYIDDILQKEYFFTFLTIKSKYIVAITKQTENEINLPLEINLNKILEYDNNFIK